MKAITTILIMLILAQTAAALSLGISPGRIDFNDVLKGGYAERDIVVSTNSPDQIVITIKKEGEMGEFISFQPNTTRFVLSSAQPYTLRVMASPPKDARNNTYQGALSFTTEGFGNLTSRAGGFIRTGVRMQMGLRITGLENLACSAGGIDISDAEQGEALTITAKIKNSGNVRIKPEIDVTIWDQDKQNKVLQKTAILDELFPTAERVLSGQLQNSLKPGQYWAELYVRQCQALRQASFDVVEKGTISDKADISSIDNPPWAYVNDSVPIKVTFSNLGQRPITGQFKGTVYLDNKLVKTLQSDELISLPGEGVEMAMYFVPEEPGRYIISGKGYYNKKVTSEQASILSVNLKPQETREATPMLPLIVYVVIIVTILVMVRKIIKRRT